MSAKVIWIVVASLVIVVGMFIAGKLADKDDDESGEKKAADGK